jgi:hypothetical protein
MALEMRISIGRLVCWIALVISVLVASGAAAQDLTIVSRVTFGNSESTSTQYITAERIRTTDGDNDTIVEFPSGKATIADHKKKQYFETSMEEMSAYFDRIVRDRSMRRLFGFDEDAKLEKLPGKKKFAGYDCEHYSLSVGDALELDFWAAPTLQPPPHYFDGRKYSFAAMGAIGKAIEKAYDQMKKVQGFPLATAVIVRTPMSRTQTDSEATEVRKGAIPGSAFEIPAGYKKVKSPFEK